MRIAIIGAGISGLAAASRLHQFGADVTLFEKSRGPGGRMATRRVDGYAFDHGAQYFTVKDDRFGNHVASWVNNGVTEIWKGQIGTAIEGTITPLHSGIPRYVGSPRMSAITRYMALPHSITYNTRVGDAHYEQGRWTLTDDSSNEFGHYEALIVTTPPLQALPFVEQSAALKEEIESIHMMPCWTLMASFNTPLNISYDGLYIKKSPLSWVCRNNSKPNRPSGESWVLHGSPEWSVEHLEEDPATIKAALLTAFFESLDVQPIEPVFARAHRWRYARAARPLNKEFLMDSPKRLAVCGDWCKASRVEDAFLSGLAAANWVSDGLTDIKSSASISPQTP